MEIGLGPLVIPDETPTDYRTDEMQPVGRALQLLLVQEAINIPLYLRRSRFAQTRTLHDYFYPDAALDTSEWINLKFTYRPDVDVVETPKGRFFSLLSFLCGLYNNERVPTSATTLFDELAGELSLDKVTIETPATGVPEDLMSSTFADRGFCIQRIEAYGARVLVDLCYVASSDRHTTAGRRVFSSGGIDFRPKPDGSLGDGVWSKIRSGFWQILHNECVRGYRGRPSDVLSELGRTHALAQFTWTPLAKMTPKEARQKREDLIMKRRDLHTDLKSLARELKRVGLYSPNSKDSQITTFIQSVISKR